MATGSSLLCVEGFSKPLLSRKVKISVPFSKA